MYTGSDGTGQEAVTARRAGAGVRPAGTRRREKLLKGYQQDPHNLMYALKEVPLVAVWVDVGSSPGRESSSSRAGSGGASQVHWKARVGAQRTREGKRPAVKSQRSAGPQGQGSGKFAFFTLSSL